jgi:hypothetical protein
MFGVLLVGMELRLHRWHEKRSGVPTQAATFG